MVVHQGSGSAIVSISAGGNASIKRGIETPRDFLREFIEADAKDFAAAPDNLRLAFHYAGSLFHMRDWIFANHQNQMKWATPKDAQDYLENACLDFALIRDVANSSKHFVLHSHGTDVDHVNRTFRSISGGAFEDGAFNDDAFAGPTTEILIETSGSLRQFADVAKNVHAMWDDLFTTNRW